MINKEKHILVIDIGSQNLVAALGKINRTNCVKFRGYALNENINTNSWSSVAKQVKQNINNFENTLNSKINEIYIGTTGQYSRSYNQKRYIDISGKKITKKIIDEFIKENRRISLDIKEEVIGLYPHNYLLDDNQKFSNPINQKAKKLYLNSHIIIGNKKHIHKIKKAFEEVKILNVNVLFNLISTAKGILKPVERKLGVAMIDIGASTTDIVIYKENKIQYTTVLPYGGNLITKNIQETFSISHEDAEELKKKYGVAIKDLANNDKIEIRDNETKNNVKEIYVNQLAEVIQTSAEEIGKLIKIKIEREGWLDKLQTGIVLTGGGTILKNILTLFFNIFNKKIRVGTPIDKLDNDKEKMKTKGLNAPNFSSVLSLLLQAAKEENKKNIPPKLPKKTNTNNFNIFKSLRNMGKKIVNSIDQEVFDVKDEKIQ